jgi:hypothetical protein
MASSISFRADPQFAGFVCTRNDVASSPGLPARSCPLFWRPKFSPTCTISILVKLPVDSIRI